ncbi:MAG: alpha/beta hydrolase [Sporocytophaga sp.]|uniref:alpha/beta hydrolase n=1 Tax=Sporocytophaga sp. TaxID=2231183 RepID=UPI001B29102A|nr:alpha/beta hydrolase [Sporocytophaga sp.]MBO9698632.1 alpha/beta hydrolase [Sporocytophaga sp.]
MKTVILLLSICLTSVLAFAQEKASDKNVVFIHGAWSTGEVWNNYKHYFTEQGYNTISPTFHYHSVEPNDSLIGVSMEDYVNQIRKVLLTFENPPTIVAHSMGCIIAQRLAVEGLIGKMILIAPPTNYGMMPPSKSIKSVKWVNKVKHLKDNVAKPTFEQAVIGMLHNLSEEKQKEVYYKMTSESGLVMKEMIWIKNLFGKQPNKIEYSKICNPVLFVSGGIDNASPVRISEKLFKKYKSPTELKVFENNAHWMMEEDNWKEIAKYIKSWIGE